MPLNYQALASKTFSPIEHTYSERDTILYALSLGLGSADAGRDELRYVFEDNLRAFPTMAVIMGSPGPWYKDPELEISWQHVVHGEQELCMVRALPPAGTLICETSLDSVVDKGADKGAIVHLKRRIQDKLTGETIAELRTSSFLRKDGGYAGPSAAPLAAPVAAPDRPADYQVVSATSYRTAMLYRLNGDLNPLHIDPGVAAKAGFPKPILHGLCTYGMAAVSVARAIGCDSNEISNISARFTAPLYPGETVRTDIWKRDGRSFVFRSHCVERALVVLDNGRFILK
ncbi:MAG: MaoC/PaaZ C-terminal domain-containing protein [Pseudomonadota bacterium]